MDAMTENTIRQEQVKSFGQMIAGFSHDMKNHLGIIRESNGLMSDIIEMGVLGDDETSAERLKKSIAAIERRIVVAADKLNHLSGFAHRPDTPYSSFQINDLIMEEYSLLERFSRLRQINFTLELVEGLPTIYNDASLLQHVIYRLYIHCLDQLSSGQALTVISGRSEDKAQIVFRLSGAAQVPFELSDNILLAAIKKLEAAMEPGVTGTDHAEVILTISSLSSEE